jgi:hypothetical protein
MGMVFSVEVHSPKTRLLSLAGLFALRVEGSKAAQLMALEKRGVLDRVAWDIAANVAIVWMENWRWFR